MRKKSNQRITKIKIDAVEELLKQAESIPVEQGTSLQEAGADLTPYPDMNNLRVWIRDYLLKGMNKVFPVKLTKDGQTYFTTILDGLPLFTKLTKSITYSSISEKDFVQPILQSNGQVGGTAFAVEVSSEIEGFEGYHCVSNKGEFISNSSSSTYQYITFYIPTGLVLTAIDITSTRYFRNLYDVYGSNDNSTWTNLGQLYVNSSTVHTTYSTTTSFKYIKVEAGLESTQIQSEYKVNLPHGFKLVGKVVGGSSGTAETSKPGLWLSNLASVYKESLAGGYVRQNIIHSGDAIGDTNADTIGNLSYSFLQSGIFHRDAGSSHSNNDSYTQHWSPSALSCISHDAAIIPTNNLCSTYTSYQSLVTPVDPDMQSYSETVSKDITYSFANNSDNLSTTTFNGAVVGRGSNYVLTITPNSDSTGFSVTGDIIYDVRENTCSKNYTQHINKKFKDYMATTPDDDSSTEPIEDQLNNPWKTIKFQLVSCHGWRQISTPFLYWTGTYEISGTTSAEGIWLYNDFIRDYEQTAYSKKTTVRTEYVGGNVGYKYTGWSVITSSVESSPCYSAGWCGEYRNCYTTFRYRKYIAGTTGEPKENVDVYVNIVDLRKQYESQGLPWNDSEERFSITTGLFNVTNAYTNSVKIASGVNISSAGVISGLSTTTIRG